jgi:hypothetical protein
MKDNKNLPSIANIGNISNDDVSSGDVISDAEKEQSRRLQKQELEKEKKRRLIKYIAEKKKIPHTFGIRCAKLERPMYDTRYEYMCALEQDDEFLDDKVVSLDSHAIGGLFGEFAYNSYREGYEYCIKEQYQSDFCALSQKFREFKFKKHINFIERYVKAVQTILYNADKLYIKDSVVKLTSWVQWFRYVFFADKPKKLITPNALFFFSGIGGTGKSEILSALSDACAELQIPCGYVTTSGISGKFITSDVKRLNLGIISEAMWHSQRGRDVNIDTINNIIDKIEIDFEQKGKQIVRLQTNMTLVGATNSRYLNRRFSIVPFNELEITAELKPPSHTELINAWIDLIKYCPSPDDSYYDVQIMNQKSPQAASEDILSVFDCFYRAGEIHYRVLSVREIIKKITNKDRESIRDRRFILNALKQLIALEILKKNSPPSNDALIVSKVEIIDEEKFENLISQYNPDEMREAQNSGFSKDKKIADIIFELYVMPIKEKIEDKIVELETENLKIKNELETLDKPDSKKFLKQLDIQTDIEIYQQILDVIAHYAPDCPVQKEKPPD